MMIVFLIGIDRIENNIVCTAFSVLIQYFTLASVFWMGAEAMLMGKKLVFDVFGRVSMFKFTLLLSFLAWGELDQIHVQSLSVPTHAQICHQNVLTDIQLLWWLGVLCMLLTT